MRPFAILITRLAAREMDRAKEQGDPVAIDRELGEMFDLVAACPEMGALARRGPGWSKTVQKLLLDRCHRVLYYRVNPATETITVLRFPHEKQRPPRV